MISPLNQKLSQVKWGEFSYKKIFNQIVQGKRLKKDDHIPGKIPFIMAGITNTGVANYIANPVSIFPGNSITIDIFGNVFYRNFEFGAGDDTGVYWNDENHYSREVMIFFAATMAKSLKNKFSYGKKLRSSQSHDFKMKLPIRNGEIDFEFINSFVAELEAERVAELEAYLSATGLKDYVLSKKEQQLIEHFDNINWKKFKLINIFNVKNTSNILSRDITENSGVTPYLCASAENNSVSSYITYSPSLLNKGNCIFISGKTFVVTYQKQDFYSNDSHNLALYLKEENFQGELTLLFIATCIRRSLEHKYTWGDSISNKKIQNDVLMLPMKCEKIDFESMATLISAVKKLVIKDVVEYADRKMAATKKAVQKP